MDPKYDKEFQLSDTDETFNRLEALANESDRLWRMGLAFTMRELENRRKSEVKMILQRINRAEKRILGPVRIAEMVKTELSDDKQVEGLKTEVKRLWAMYGLLVISIIGIVVSKALK